MEVMDSGNYITESPRLAPLLYRQFEEQSSLCDAIIRTGSWEKRFHWCVLVASPFFDNIQRNNYLERQTGIVNLNKWPASVLEMALLFLYGRLPVVTEANVGILMDIAEFLLIPELKMICIEYFKETNVTVDNCMQLYDLSSMYGLSQGLSQGEYENFIKGKLPEVLEQERMLNTTSDSLKLLLTDPTLSYVSVQTWFQFLVRWAHKTQRQDMFVELLSLLEFSACDREFLDNTVAKEPLVTNADEEVKERLVSVQDDSVVIFGCLGQYNKFKYFNMRTKLWYRICLSMDSDSEDYSKFRQCPIAGVKSSNSSCIYKLDRRHRFVHVLTYDLNNAQYKLHSVEKPAVSSGADHHVVDDGDDHDGGDYYDLREFSTGTDSITAVSNTLVRTPEQSERPSDDPISRHHQRLDSYQYRSTLHIIKLDEPVPKLHAVLSLKDHLVSAQARSNNGTVAMLTEDKEKLFLYNDSTCELECIQLNEHGIELGFNTHAAAFKDDFVLYDDDSVILILRLSGASLEKKYLVKQLTWTSDNNHELYEYDARYRFDGDRWFRLTLQSTGYLVQDLIIKYVSHNDLLKTENTASLCWEEIPIPPEAKIRHSFELNIFSVSLPKGAAQCHLNCPHCKMVLFEPDVEDEFDDDDYNELYSQDGGSSSDDNSDSDDDPYIF